MATPTDELVQRMLSAVARISADRVDEIVAEARTQAEAEIKSLLKSAIKAVLLQRAVERLENTDRQPGAETRPSASDRVQMGTGCYVYAIARSDHPVPQIAQVSLRPVTFKDLQAITAEVSLAEWDKAATQERTNDLAWIEQKARHHDSVLKSLLTASPIIPLRLGTVLRDEEVARRVLERHAEPLRANLAALEGKKEWGVKVILDAEAVAKQVEQRDRQPAGTGSGRAYFAQRQRAGATKAQVTRLAQACADDCHEQLSAVATGAVVLPAHKGESSDAQVVSNTAYLVADAEALRFHRLVDQLTSRYEPHGLSLQVTGPWPPYNFVRLDLSLEAQ